MLRKLRFSDFLISAMHWSLEKLAKSPNLLASPLLFHLHPHNSAFRISFCRKITLFMYCHQWCTECLKNWADFPILLEATFFQNYAPACSAFVMRSGFQHLNVSFLVIGHFSAKFDCILKSFVLTLTQNPSITTPNVLAQLCTWLQHQVRIPSPVLGKKK